MSEEYDPEEDLCVVANITKNSISFLDAYNKETTNLDRAQIFNWDVHISWAPDSVFSLISLKQAKQTLNNLQAREG